MQSSEKVSDRLSDNPEDNSYINKMSLPKVRVWIRYRARATAGVKGNFRHSHVNNMGCRLSSQDSDETQEHLQLCEGTKFERKGLDTWTRETGRDLHLTMTILEAIIQNVDLEL